MKFRSLLTKKILIPLFLVLLIFAAFSIYWAQYLAKAHSTFENYYAFRGCVQLLVRTDNYGVCRLASGQTIKIVKFHDQWYLDGDLPCGFLCF